MNVKNTFTLSIILLTLLIISLTMYMYRISGVLEDKDINILLYKPRNFFLFDKENVTFEQLLVIPGIGKKRAIHVLNHLKKYHDLKKFYTRKVERYFK